MEKIKDIKISGSVVIIIILITIILILISYTIGHNLGYNGAEERYLGAVLPFNPVYLEENSLYIILNQDKSFIEVKEYSKGENSKVFRAPKREIMGEYFIVLKDHFRNKYYFKFLKNAGSGE